MPIIKAELTDKDFGFTITDETNNQMKIDIPESQGGNSKGLRPMHTILAALCGCSGVDVVSILKKQRQTYDTFSIEVDGQREVDKVPSLWKEINLKYIFTGEVSLLKAYHAVDLSINKYCSVAETLRKSGAKITFVVSVNGVVYTS